MPAVNLHVELLSFTPNPEEIVAMAAKVCYSSDDITALKQGVEEKDQAKFLDKLMDMHHFSPIEHVSFTFGIEGVSRSLLAQITRHRIASFSVKSQRYVSAHSNVQGAFNYVIPPSILELGSEATEKYEQQMMTMQQWYDEWVDALGKKGEKSNQDARFVLPNASETKMVMTMNARELMHFFSLRCCRRAQWEIRALADQMLQLVKVQAPSLFAYAGPGCVSGVCPEGSKTCGAANEVRVKYLAQNIHRNE